MKATLARSSETLLSADWLSVSRCCWSLWRRLIVENDHIVGYQLRLPEQKQRAVAAFKSLNYHVISAGDSFNDTAMLKEADAGFLFHAPGNVKKQFPQFKAVDEYSELLSLIKNSMG